MPPIERSIRRYSGENTIASTVAHKTALKKGQRIEANARDTAMTSSKKVRSSRLRTQLSTVASPYRRSDDNRVTGDPPEKLRCPFGCW